MPILYSTAIVVLVAFVLFAALVAMARLISMPLARKVRSTPLVLTKSERAVRMQIECLAAGHISQSYNPVGGGMGSYGELWGRTKSGELAWIDLFQDPFFSSLESHIEALATSREMVPEASLDILGELADPSPSGRPYDFNHRVYCPACGSPEVRTSTDSDPVMELVVLPVVTHRHWDRQSEPTRRRLVMEALERHGWTTKPTSDA